MGGKYHGSEHYRVSTHPLLSSFNSLFIQFLKLLHGVCSCCTHRWFFFSVFCCVRRWLSLFLFSILLSAFASFESLSSFFTIYLTTNSIIKSVTLSIASSAIKLLMLALLHSLHGCLPVNSHSVIALQSLRSR